ncbi:MAG: transcription-repair coupling factor [Desulfobacterales bacterium]
MESHWSRLVFEPGRPVDFSGLSGPAAAYAVSRIYETRRLPMLVVLPDGKAARRFHDDLRFFMGDGMPPPMLFSAYNILPYKFVAYHNETAAGRIRILYQLLESPHPNLVVTYVDALLKRVIPKGELQDFAELVMVNEEVDREALVRKLSSGGYTRSVIVEEPGDFSIRGGILDVFTPLYPDPLRIEFFGDTVDSIRFFLAATQRKTGSVEEAVILPAREAVLRASVMDEVINRVRRQGADLELPVSATRKIVEQIRERQSVTNIESLLPLVYPSLDTLTDYLPGGTLMVGVEPSELADAAGRTLTLAERHFESSIEEKRLCVPPDALYIPWSAIEDHERRAPALHIRSIGLSTPLEAENDATALAFNVTENTDLTVKLQMPGPEGRNFQPLVDWIAANRRQRVTSCIICGDRHRRERVLDLLAGYDIPAVHHPRWPGPGRHGGVVLCEGKLSSGFFWGEESIALITEAEIFGAWRQRVKRKDRKRGRELLNLGDLKVNDLVVHDDHGIGRYDGLTRLRIEGVENEFLSVVYRDGDRLYVPVDRMGLIQKYMGVDDSEPPLDKMGGKSWDRVKERVKRTAEKIAGELLKLYAARKVSPGHAFRDIDTYASEFAAGFPYEETPDQIKAIEDVLEDMRRKEPMDRLVCGDVGYGKTEVALRAAFRAVNNGKQVAVLVPTTVLAEQHFETFSSRFKALPVSVACLSRFRPPREQRQIVASLAEGKVDIVIGTHRLLQKDIVFKELGLIVIDEEQRFGVRHKEKLKKLRASVDVLALTATPIPRTLHLSMVGIRDISLISTPPEYRRSIITYVSEYDEGIVKEAVRREIERGGQVFFVHNHIQSIDRMADRLRQIVPEARVGVAHGQMDEDALETVMMQFYGREIDVLVCTTIIESGLDISSANTILVNRADRFGLAQIYQLRGRVGRSEEQAYAFLFIPRETTLTEDAKKRLKVLMEHSDLGAGFQIAMSDLKIRGGGTILGASQSGHIAAVGYDMFLKLMEEAISELKGEPHRAPLEPEINVPFSALLPDDYVPDIDQRMALYRRMSGMRELKELAELKAELSDRYGPLPDAVNQLLLKMGLRILAVKAGVQKLDLTDGRLSLAFSVEHQKQPEALVDLIAANPGRYRLSPEQVLSVRIAKSSVGGMFTEAKNILKDIELHVNKRNL